MSRLEVAAAGVAAAVLVVLVVLEPDILGAPFQSSRAVAFTFGGTALAAVALFVMVRLGVPAPARVAVLGVPFALVSWWLLSPFFTEDTVDEAFDTSIEAASPAGQEPTGQPPAGSDETPPPTEPVLLARGSFVGLAGHDGTGDAALFRLPDGAQVLRFENFDIDNGPDLRVYLVPGAGQRSLAPEALYLGRLKGNVGNQTYDLPSDAELGAGQWTALVWCEAFTVEFVGATLDPV